MIRHIDALGLWRLVMSYPAISVMFPSTFNNRNTLCENVSLNDNQGRDGQLTCSTQTELEPRWFPWGRVYLEPGKSRCQYNRPEGSKVPILRAQETKCDDSFSWCRGR